MTNYAKIRDLCEKNSSISASFIDEFFVYFIAAQEGLQKKVFRKLDGFQNIIRKMPDGWMGMVASQLIIHQAFKKDGLAGKYTRHVKLQQRTQEEQEYLKYQIEHPWRYSFCTLKKQLNGDFFEMSDAVTDETFLLYSPGITRTIDDLGTIPGIWLFLIGFNGACWQTFGTLAYFKGYQPFDLFFFAKQVRPEIVFHNEISEVIESDPVPFTMLFSGAELPVSFHKKDMVVFHRSDYHVDDFLPENFAEDFRIEKKHPITMLTSKRWGSYPHFAKCFHHHKKSHLILTAMTERGYTALLASLKRQQNTFPTEPDIRATPGMFFTAQNILGTSIDMSPYEKHFSKPVSSEEKQILDKINTFARLLLERLNNREEYDLLALAEQASIDRENAESIAESILKKLADNSWKR